MSRKGILSNFFILKRQIFIIFFIDFIRTLDKEHEARNSLKIYEGGTTPVVSSIQSKNDDTRVKPLGRFCPHGIMVQETIPINRFPVMSGPPESPLQTPTPETCAAQMVLL